MITKIPAKKGMRIVGLVYYLFGPGRHEEHEDPRLVGHWEGLPSNVRLSQEEIYELARELDAPRILHGAPDDRHVWHLAVSNHADDRMLSDEEWARVAQASIDEMGFNDCRWIAVRHADDHIHVAVQLRKESGAVAGYRNDRPRMRSVAARMREELALGPGRTIDGSGQGDLSRAEYERAQREGREPERWAVERLVRAAAAEATDQASFENLLTRHGLSFRYRQEHGNVVGWSVDSGIRTGAGDVVWIGGGKLAPDMTWGALQDRWDGAEGRLRFTSVASSDAVLTKLENRVQEWTKRPPQQQDIELAISLAADAMALVARRHGKPQVRRAARLLSQSIRRGRKRPMPQSGRRPHQDAMSAGLAAVGRANAAIRGGQAGTILPGQVGRIAVLLAQLRARTNGAQAERIESARLSLGPDAGAWQIVEERRARRAAQREAQSGVEQQDGRD